VSLAATACACARTTHITAAKPTTIVVGLATSVGIYEENHDDETPVVCRHKSGQ